MSWSSLPAGVLFGKKPFFYDVSKQKGSSRWYPHKIETPKVPAGPLGDKKQALHAAAELMGVSYPEYMELRRKKGCA